MPDKFGQWLKAAFLMKKTIYRSLKQCLSNGEALIVMEQKISMKKVE
jgi:hypothetical protein